MLKKSIPLLVLFTFFSCNQEEERYKSFLKENCDLHNYTCKVDLRDFYNLDYDTIFVFGEFTHIDGIKKILDLETYWIGLEWSIGDREFLVQDSYNKIVLKKNGKVLYNKNVKVPHLYDYDNGKNLLVNIPFDGKKMEVKATIYTNDSSSVITVIPSDVLLRE